MIVVKLVPNPICKYFEQILLKSEHLYILNKYIGVLGKISTWYNIYIYTTL